MKNKNFFKKWAKWKYSAFLWQNKEIKKHKYTYYIIWYNENTSLRHLEDLRLRKMKHLYKHLKNYINTVK